MHPFEPTLAVDWLQLILAAGLTVTLTSACAALIHRPLYGVLELVCGTPVAARFWTTFAAILIVMGPLFLVFTAAGGAANLADFVRRAVYLVSFGIIGAFLIMGAAVILSAPSRAVRDRRVSETADGTPLGGPLGSPLGGVPGGAPARLAE